MWICALGSLRPRFPGGLLLSLLLLLTSPSVVQAAAGNEADAPDCAQTGLGSQPVAVQLTRTAELVQAALHSTPSDLLATGCLASLQFQVPEGARPPYVVWRDVEVQAVRRDGTPDPAHPDPLSLRLWIHPDGVLHYEVREAGVNAAHAALNLEVAWGTTAAANDLAVLDVLSTALGLELSPQKLGIRLHGGGRVTELDWYDDHPYETYEFIDGERTKTFPMRGIHPPGVRVMWQLPSELGQLSQLQKLSLGGPLLTGTIPPELGQLANLEELTLAGSRLTGAVPPELGQLIKLRKLELHSNQLTALPPELGRLTQMYRLGVAGNQLISLPPQMGQLAQLQLLGLAGNQLTTLPPELGQLTRLRGLGLAGNRLTTIPPELGQLPSLRFLDVQDNQLTSLPSLAGLEQLHYLDLSGNRLTRLPPGLEQIPVLSYLDLSDNRLSILPSAWLRPRWSTVVETVDGGRDFLVYKLVDLVKHGTAGLLSSGSPLKVLDLSGNRLTALPPELGQLRLERLDLSDNRLVTLPRVLGKLRPPAFFAFFHGAEPHLTLGLSGNRLTDLPPELGRISNLVQLDLSDNQLTDLPDALFRLDQLQALNLSGNQLGTVPPTIGDLTTVVNLDLADNQLTTLPPELGQLSQLDSLNLSGNRLTTIPPELEQASNLGHLNLSGNQLTNLPPELGQLSQLDSLNLSGNQLTAASLDLTRLPILKTLNLSHNQLTDLPLDLDQLRYLDHLKHLTRLDLSDNRLTDLPLTLDHLKHLTHLDLSNNRLTDLPLTLDHLKHLTHLDLSDNQFTVLPPVLSQLRPLLSLALRGNPLTTCLLPLPWQMDRYIFPPDYEYYGNLDQWLLSPPISAESSDLPFLELCSAVPDTSRLASAENGTPRFWMESALGVIAGGRAHPDNENLPLMYFENFGVNPFVSADKDALSSFALDGDTTAYKVTRHYLQNGVLPPQAAIRTEEFVNAFDGGYRASAEGPSLHLDAAPAPFAPEGYVLLRVGVAAPQYPEEREPVTLIFVVDVGRSMADNHRLETVQRTIQGLLDRTTSADRVALVAYGREAHIMAPLQFSEDAPVLRQAIEKLMVTSGVSDTAAGLRLGYDMAVEDTRRGFDVRLVLFTDGMVNGEETDPEEILALVDQVAQIQATLTTVGVGASGRYGDVMMENLAHWGNGTYHYIENPEAADVFLAGPAQTVFHRTARGARIQVEFNPETVWKYRLLGYENSTRSDHSFQADPQALDAKGFRSDVTALYEVRPLWETPQGPIATAHLRYRDLQSGAVVTQEATIVWSQVQPANRYFQQQASVAEWAELLGQSFFAQCGSLEAVLAHLPLAWDESGQELETLIRNTQLLFRPFCQP